MTAPDWLTKRDGGLKAGLNDAVTLVLFSGQPQYRVEVRPAGGAYTCAVTASVSGKRLDDPAATYPDPAAAQAGGLAQLKDKLGW